MNLNSPLSEAKAQRLLAILGPGPATRVVDFGCGDGTFLTWLYRTTGANCLGLDIDASLIDAARTGVDLPPDATLEYKVADVAAESLPGESLDLAICMGASHAFCEGEPAFRTALQAMMRLLKPQGQILVGEGYWKREPDPEYLAFLGEPTGIYNSHDENLQLAESLGLVPVYATESNDDEWDDFEWRFRLRAEREAMARPDDPELRARRDKVRTWNAMYRRYGRSTMGYAHYVFVKP